MLLLILITLLAQLQGLNGQAVDHNGITLDEKKQALEREMLNPFTLTSVVRPCSINFNDNPARGQQTSAEWLRIVFHDMITANLAGPGLGGLDASIGFESDRVENSGIFINVTLSQFSQFSSVYLSMSDFIAVGLSDVLANCAQIFPGRRLPLRVGRIDATGPGPAGVPEATSSVAFSTEAFARAGFSQTEMIQAIACGHSLGGVHHPSSPNIVPPGTPDNIDGRVPFDSTPAVFDNSVIHEYLDGTGTAGGPLVVGPEATRSDLRIFSSDGNATIQGMTNPQTFEDICYNIFDKMLNTVPAAVTLSEPFLPRKWLLRQAHVDLTPTGALTYSGTIIGNGFDPLPATASYTYGTPSGNTAVRSTQPGVPYDIPIGFGTIIDYKFNETLGNIAANSINIANSYTAPINRQLFISHSRSFYAPITDGPGGPVITNRWIIRAAVLSFLAPPGTVLTAKLWYPRTQPGTVVPRIDNLTVPMTLKTTLGGYKIYQVVLSHGNVGLGGSPVVQVQLGAQASLKKEIGSGILPECTQAILTNC